MTKNRFNDLTRQALSEAFGVSVRTIANWLGAGLPRKSNGKYRLSDAISWRLEMLEGNGRELEAGDSVQLERFRKLRADLLELELEERRGNLISKDDVLRSWCGRISMFRNALLHLVRCLPPMLEASSRNEIETVLRNEIESILTAFSRDGRYTPHEGTDDETN